MPAPEKSVPAAEGGFSFSDYILTIGSAHLDVMGDYTRDQENNIDKIGMVHYAIGGTAFNIAANLAAARKPVCFYTHLRQGSLVTEAILARCRQDGINTAYVSVDEGLPESGFIAHRRQGEVMGAVSQMAISSATLDQKRLRDALRGCAFAVLDCNLVEPQIALVSQLAHEAGVPLIVAGVSEAKVNRVRSVFVPRNNLRPVRLFSCNMKEAERLMDAPEGRWTGEELLNTARAENAIVSRSRRGCLLYSHGQPDREVPAPAVPLVASTQGAGDALLSAFCGSFYDHNDFSRPDMVASVVRYVGTALASRSSTLDRRNLKESLGLPSAAQA